MSQSRLNDFFYENDQYLKMLENLNVIFYAKYISFVKFFLKNKKNSYMDIGCGNGNVLIDLKNDGYKNIFGCEISKLFVSSAKKRGLDNIYLYNGKKIPFENNFFDVVGSFGVLEHTADPINFLNEHLRIVKENGYVLVTCPNFLSVFFKLEHPRADRVSKRLKNIPIIFKKIFSTKVDFEKIKPIVREKFYPDDDMVTVTNLIDIERFFKQNNCDIVYSNGFMSKDNTLLKIIGSIPVFKYFLPSCFIVVTKGKKCLL